MIKEFVDCVDILDAHSQQVVTYNDITSNQAEQFFGLAGKLTNLENAKDDTTQVVVIPGMPTTIGAIASTILRTLAKSNGAFRVDPAKTAGQLNLASGALLVQHGVLDQTFVDTFFDIGKSVSYPYASKTQEDLVLAKATALIESVECTYPGGMGYLVKTGRQLLEFDVTILDDSTDVTFDVMIATCDTPGDQHDPDNFVDLFDGKAWFLTQGKRPHFKYQTDPSGTKSKLYNKLWLKPSKPCNFTATVMAV